ncbi:MAG: Ig-like domain-containing protein [Thermoplasmatota archaeon]
MVLLLALSSVVILMPEKASADRIAGGTLVNDEPAEASSSSWRTEDFLQFKVPTKTNFYTAVAVRNSLTGDDYDVFAYDNYDMTTLISSSTKGQDELDLVIIDGHTYTGNIKYVKVNKFTGTSFWTSGVLIESDYHCVADDLQSSDPDDDGPLEIGTYRDSLFEYGHVGVYSNPLSRDAPMVNMYDVYLESGGEYTFDLEFNDGNTGQIPHMYLFKGSGNFDDALVYDKATAANEELSFDFDPEVSGWYGLCVIDSNYASSSNEYSLLISSDFKISAEPTSKLIAPGSNVTYEIDIESLGITQDIDLSYEWRSSSSHISTPSGALAVLSQDEVAPGGVGTKKAYLNVTTTSSMSAGTYYLRVRGNDTGEGSTTHYTDVILRVSTSPDFFLSASPEALVIAPGTQAVYEVEMDTINSFSGSVNLAAASTPSHSGFNFTFNPSSISSSNPVSNLTVSTTTSLPKQNYKISINGTSGSLVRWSNVSLTTTDPVVIDLISPSLDELVAGAYTFKVKAGTPTTISSVKLTFGGRMANLGTLNAYYNSATGFWERSVNTYTFIDGACSLNITAEDISGGLTKKGPFNFTLSNSAPNPIITTPLDRSYVTGTSMNIAVNTTSHVISVRFRVDQNAWTPMSRSGNTWTGSWDTTRITDGQHTLTIDAKDTAGLTGESSITIFVDNTDPTCNMNSPIDQQYIEGSYTFRVVATDTVGVNHVDINIFGSNTTLPYNPITSSYEYTVSTTTKPDGAYKTYAVSYDNVGQSKMSDLITFYIDNNEPSLSIMQPADEQIIGGDFTISVMSEDEFLNRVEYRIDSTGWENLTGGDPYWSVVLDTTELTDGEHILSVRSRDNGSHVTSQQISFTVDNTDPVCNVVSPFNGAFMEGVGTFKISSSDLVGIDRVMLNVFSDSFQTSFNRQNGYYEYSHNTLTLSDGNYQVYATAYDLSGKWKNSTTINFKVDNQPPQLTVNGLQNGDYVSGIVDINVSVTDSFLRDVRYSIDGGSWTLLTTPWNTTMLLDGMHTLEVQARDQAGHETIQEVDLIVDNNMPVTAVNGPVDDEFIERGYTFRLSASDSVGIDRVLINVFGRNFTAIYSSASGYFEFTSDTSIQPDGNYSCYAIAYDKSGKMSISPMVNFQVDNNPPVVRVKYPLPNGYLEGFEDMDLNVTDKFLDRIEYNLDGTGWVAIDQSLNTSLFSDGPHSLQFRAFDKAGHVTTVSMDVVIDNTAPYGAISSPVEGQFLGGTPLFRVVASDIVGIDEVKINVFNATLDMNYNSGTGYYEYRTDTTLLDDGIYNYTVVVRDLSGKTLILGPVMFRIDNHYPELKIYNINNNDIISDQFEFQWTATDTFLDRVEYQVDATGWVDIDLPFNTTEFEDGMHTITIRAMDMSEKETVKIFDIYTDNIGPTCTINSPVEDEFVEGVVTIRVTAFDLVGVDYVTIKVFNIEARVPYNSQTGYYEYSSNTVTWGAGEDGIRNVTATVYDLTGKSYTFGPVNFNVDNRNPTININSPKEGQVVSGLFFFDVENGDVFKKGTDYNVDGASWQPVSIGWNTLLVPDGSHEITIRASDKAGHTTMETIHVLVDNNDPEISIASPSGNEFIEGAYIFRLSAYDEVGIRKVIINIADEEKPLSYNTQTGYYEFLMDTRSLEDGVYTVNGSVTDLAKRTVMTGDVTFRVDNTAPNLVVEAPVKDQLISGLFVVRASTHDIFAGPVKYAIDGTTWYDITTPWNTTKVGDGIHTVTIATEDQAGHVTEFEVTVITDNTKPVISQATIAPGEIISGIRTLRFYAYDSIGLRQVLMGINEASQFEIFRGEGGLYYEYILDTRILSDGNHTLRVTAYDRAGNSYTSTYGISVDNTGPLVSLDYYWIEGSEQVRIGSVKQGNSVVFEATVIDPSGVSSVMINIDSSGWREMSPDSNTSNPDTYVLFWPTGDSMGGAHVFHIRTVDTLGNENSISGLINVDKKKDKTTFLEVFTDILPLLWFILFIILVIVIIVLAYLGILTKWAKGEGYQKKEKTEEIPEGDDKTRKRIPFSRENKEEPGKSEEKASKSKNPFKKEKNEDDGVDWSD